jgi:tRNA nucleotidyltransferase (CCA-adding enzyme)
MTNAEKLLLEKIKGYNKDCKLYRVGGCVRDSFLNKVPKDIDYLVTKIPFEDLKVIISSTSEKMLSTDVGESMSVIKAIIFSEEYDFVIPRTERYIGDKHTDVIVTGDHNLSILDDLSRRDFTMNAIALDIENDEIIDPYNGVEDIKNKLIRAVGNPDIRFAEDALRIFRAVQFMSRFDFKIDRFTHQAMKKNFYRTKHISAERIFQEFRKAYVMDNGKFLTCLKMLGFGNNGLYSKNVESEIAWFVLMYLYDGNIEDIKPPREYVEVLKTVRRLSEEYLFNVMYRSKYIKEVGECLRSMGEDIDVNVPTSKDIDITSEELQELGYVEKDLGKVWKKICRAVWEKDVENKNEDIKKFLKSDS